MKRTPSDALLRLIALLGLVFVCASNAAAAPDCAYADHDANAGTGMGGTGTMAQGTGIGGTGIKLGVFRSEMQIAGSVIAIEGDAKAESNGNSRPLSSGDPVCVGDKITTPASGSIQLRMADGGLVTIRPQSQLRIEKFVYLGTSRDTSLLALDKGACRIITGNIGKLHPLNDLLKTPNATIGIREADHEATVILADDKSGYPPGTYDKVNHGTTFISTGQGDISIRPDQAGFAPHTAKEPTLLREIPGFYNANDAAK